MKGLKKVLAVTMALGTALSMTACGLGEKRDEFDPNKTTLQVGLMEGGIGRVWMDEIIANYTAKNPDVQIKVVPQKDLYNHNNRRMELFPTPKGNSYIKANEELKKIVKRLKKKTAEEEFIETRVLPILEKEEKARIKHFQKIYNKKSKK